MPLNLSGRMKQIPCDLPVLVSVSSAWIITKPAFSSDWVAMDSLLELWRGLGDVRLQRRREMVISGANGEHGRGRGASSSLSAIRSERVKSLLALSVAHMPMNSLAGQTGLVTFQASLLQCQQLTKALLKQLVFSLFLQWKSMEMRAITSAGLTQTPKSGS